MLKIIHTSDLHIGAKFSVLGEKAEVQRQALLTAFSNIVDLAISKQVHIVLIAGDLFDSNFPSYKSVDFVKHQLERLNQEKIHVVILPGTHDCFSEQSIYRRENFSIGLAYVFVFNNEITQKEFPDLDLTIFAETNTSNKSTESPMAFVKDVAKRATTKHKIAMAHGSIEIEGKHAPDDMPIPFRDIANSGVEYVALGHWHKAQNFSQGEVVAWYSGPPEILSQEGGKDGRSGCVLYVHILDKVSVEEIKVSDKEFREINIDLQVYENIENVYYELEKLSNQNLILIVNIGGFSQSLAFVDVKKIEDDFKDKFFNIQVRNNSVMQFGDVSSKNYPEELVTGQFVKIMKEKINNAKDENERKIFESALQIGIAELEGKNILES